MITIGHKYSKWVLSIVAFLLIFIIFYPLAPPNTTPKKNNLVVAVATAPRTLDSTKATDAAAIRLLRIIAPGLIKIDKNFTPKPALVEKISHVEYKTFYLKLKENITFHDDSSLTSAEVHNFFSSIMAKGSTSPLKGALSGVISIETPSKYEIIFRLKKPNPWFWNMLETPITKMVNDIPMGAGEYYISNKDEYGNISITNNNNTIHFMVVKDPAVRVLKLLKGEVDILHNDIPPELYTYAITKGMGGVHAPSASYSYIGFNMGEGSTIANAKIRKAIALSINKKEIIAGLLGGAAQDASSLLLPTHPAYWAAPETIYNPKEAKRLLAEAGYKNGLKLNLSITNNPFILRLAQVIQQQLKAVNITLTISPSEWGTFYGNIKKGNFEMYILTWVGAFQPDFLYNIFHSNMMPPSGANRGRYNNPIMDKLLDKMVAETDDSTRKNIAIKVQKLQAKDNIYLPLWRKNHVALSTPKIGKYFLPADGGYEGIISYTNSQNTEN